MSQEDSESGGDRGSSHANVGEGQDGIWDQVFSPPRSRPLKPYGNLASQAGAGTGTVSGAVAAGKHEGTAVNALDASGTASRGLSMLQSYAGCDSNREEHRHMEPQGETVPRNGYHMDRARDGRERPRFVDRRERRGLPHRAPRNYGRNTVSDWARMDRSHGSRRHDRERDRDGERAESDRQYMRSRTGHYQPVESYRTSQSSRRIDDRSRSARSSSGDRERHSSERRRDRDDRERSSRYSSSRDDRRHDRDRDTREYVRHDRGSRGHYDRRGYPDVQSSRPRYADPPGSHPPYPMVMQAAGPHGWPPHARVHINPYYTGYNPMAVHFNYAPPNTCNPPPAAGLPGQAQPNTAQSPLSTAAGHTQSAYAGNTIDQNIKDKSEEILNDSDKTLTSTEKTPPKDETVSNSISENDKDSSVNKSPKSRKSTTKSSSYEYTFGSSSDEDDLNPATKVAESEEPDLYENLIVEDWGCAASAARKLEGLDEAEIAMQNEGITKRRGKPAKKKIKLTIRTDIHQVSTNDGPSPDSAGLNKNMVENHENECDKTTQQSDMNQPRDADTAANVSSEERPHGTPVNIGSPGREASTGHQPSSALESADKDENGQGSQTSLDEEIAEAAVKSDGECPSPSVALPGNDQHPPVMGVPGSPVDSGNDEDVHHNAELCSAESVHVSSIDIGADDLEPNESDLDSTALCSIGSPCDDFEDLLPEDTVAVATAAAADDDDDLTPSHPEEVIPECGNLPDCKADSDAAAGNNGTFSDGGDTLKYLSDNVTRALGKSLSDKHDLHASSHSAVLSPCDSSKITLFNVRIADEILNEKTVVETKPDNKDIANHKVTTHDIFGTSSEGDCDSDSCNEQAPSESEGVEAVHFSDEHVDMSDRSLSEKPIQEYETKSSDPGFSSEPEHNERNSLHKEFENDDNLSCDGRDTDDYCSHENGTGPEYVQESGEHLDTSPAHQSKAESSGGVGLCSEDDNINDNDADHIGHEHGVVSDHDSVDDSRVSGEDELWESDIERDIELGLKSGDPIDEKSESEVSILDVCQDDGVSSDDDMGEDADAAEEEAGVVVSTAYSDEEPCVTADELTPTKHNSDSVGLDDSDLGDQPEQSSCQQSRSGVVDEVKSPDVVQRVSLNATDPPMSTPRGPLTNEVTNTEDCVEKHDLSTIPFAKDGSHLSPGKLMESCADVDTAGTVSDVASPDEMPCEEGAHKVRSVPLFKGVVGAEGGGVSAAHRLPVHVSADLAHDGPSRPTERSPSPGRRQAPQTAADGSPHGGMPLVSPQQDSMSRMNLCSVMTEDGLVTMVMMDSSSELELGVQQGQGYTVHGQGHGERHGHQKHISGHSRHHREGRGHHSKGYSGGNSRRRHHRNHVNNNDLIHHADLHRPDLRHPSSSPNDSDHKPHHHSHHPHPPHSYHPHRSRRRNPPPRPRPPAQGHGSHGSDHPSSPTSSPHLSHEKAFKTHSQYSNSAYRFPAHARSHASAPSHARAPSQSVLSDSDEDRLRFNLQPGVVSIHQAARRKRYHKRRHKHAHISAMSSSEDDTGVATCCCHGSHGMRRRRPHRSPHSDLMPSIPSRPSRRRESSGHRGPANKYIKTYHDMIPKHCQIPKSYPGPTLSPPQAAKAAKPSLKRSREATASHYKRMAVTSRAANAIASCSSQQASERPGCFQVLYECYGKPQEARKDCPHPTSTHTCTQKQYAHCSSQTDEDLLKATDPLCHNRFLTHSNRHSPVKRTGSDSSRLAYQLLSGNGAYNQPFLGHDSPIAPIAAKLSSPPRSVHMKVKRCRTENTDKDLIPPGTESRDFHVRSHLPKAENVSCDKAGGYPSVASHKELHRNKASDLKIQLPPPKCQLGDDNNNEPISASKLLNSPTHGPYYAMETNGEKHDQNKKIDIGAVDCLRDIYLQNDGETVSPIKELCPSINFSSTKSFSQKESIRNSTAESDAEISDVVSPIQDYSPIKSVCYSNHRESLEAGNESEQQCVGRKVAESISVLGVENDCVDSDGVCDENVMNDQHDGAYEDKNKRPGEQNLKRLVVDTPAPGVSNGVDLQSVNVCDERQVVASVNGIYSVAPEGSERIVIAGKLNQVISNDSLDEVGSDIVHKITVPEVKESKMSSHNANYSVNRKLSKSKKTSKHKSAHPIKTEPVKRLSSHNKGVSKASKSVHVQNDKSNEKPGSAAESSSSNSSSSSSDSDSSSDSESTSSSSSSSSNSSSGSSSSGSSSDSSSSSSNDEEEDKGPGDSQPPPDHTPRDNESPQHNGRCQQNMNHRTSSDQKASDSPNDVAAVTVKDGVGNLDPNTLKETVTPDTTTDACNPAGHNGNDDCVKSGCDNMIDSVDELQQCPPKHNKIESKVILCSYIPQQLNATCQAADSTVPEHEEACATDTCQEACATNTCQEACATDTCQEACATDTCQETCTTYTCQEACATDTCQEVCATYTCQEACATDTCQEACATDTCQEACATDTCQEACATDTCQDNTKQPRIPKAISVTNACDVTTVITTESSTKDISETQSLVLKSIVIEPSPTPAKFALTWSKVQRLVPLESTGFHAALTRARQQRLHAKPQDNTQANVSPTSQTAKEIQVVENDPKQTSADHKDKSHMASEVGCTEFQLIGNTYKQTVMDTDTHVNQKVTTDHDKVLGCDNTKDEKSKPKISENACRKRRHRDSVSSNQSESRARRRSLDSSHRHADKRSRRSTRHERSPKGHREFQRSTSRDTSYKSPVCPHQKDHSKSVPCSYCFVDFPDMESAQYAQLRLNGKIIPGSSPPVRFKLNHASYGRSHLLSPEYSLFVGDLDVSVDDYTLFNTFAQKYKSCKIAKVVLDECGKTRGYGFVRFTDENDQQRALVEMNGARVAGRTIHVHMAVPKRRSNSQQTLGQKYSDQYQNYPQNYQQTYPGYDSYNYMQQYWNPYGYQEYTPEQLEQEDEFALEDPCEEINVDRLNHDFMEQSEELYIALEDSRWFPLDNVYSSITTEVN